MLRYIVHKANGIDGPQISQSEPCIVIRGQDVLALAMLDTYMALYHALYIGNKSLTNGGDVRVMTELAEHRNRLLAWQEIHGTKIADR